MLLIMECFGNHLLKIKLELIRCGEVSQSDAAGQNIYSVVARPVSTFNNPWTSPVLFYFISEGPKPDSFFRNLCPSVNSDIDKIESNWRSGRFKLEKINCQSENSKGVYCLQYDDDKIVSGLRDNTIKLWDRKTLECRATLTGHTGSVLCLQEWFKSVQYANTFSVTGVRLRMFLGFHIAQ